MEWLTKAHTQLKNEMSDFVTFYFICHFNSFYYIQLNLIYKINTNFFKPEYRIYWTSCKWILTILVTKAKVSDFALETVPEEISSLKKLQKNETFSVPCNLILFTTCVEMFVDNMQPLCSDSQQVHRYCCWQPEMHMPGTSFFWCTSLVPQFRWYTVPQFHQYTRQVLPSTGTPAWYLILLVQPSTSLILLVHSPIPQFHQYTSLEPPFTGTLAWYLLLLVH